LTEANFLPEDIDEVYKKIKEGILYSFPFRWTDSYTTERTKRGHCGSKAELLAHKLKELGYKVRYVLGYRCGMMPKILWPKFSDVHIWIEVQLGGKWLTLDPTPDRAFAFLIGDTQPGTHISEPEYIQRLDSILPWYKDVYNSWLILPYKILVNFGFTIIRWYLALKKSV